MINIIECLAVGFTLTGVTYNINKKRTGFLWWIIANIFWIIIYFQKQMPLSIGLMIIFIILNILGWLKWKE